MRTFRCFDTNTQGCAPVCEPGGCGCQEVANGHTDGADVDGNKNLRPYPRTGIIIENPNPIIGPAFPVFTSEQSNGENAQMDSHTFARFPAGRLSALRQASCYTPLFGDNPIDPNNETFDLFGCPGLDPFVFPNDYTACGHVKEAEDEMIRRICVPAQQGAADIAVSFGGENEYNRMIFAHTEPCVVLDNTRAWGNLWRFGGGVGQDISASPIGKNAWEEITIKFNGIGIKRDVVRETLTDPDNIAMQNAVLQQFNNPAWLDAMNLDRLYNQRHDSTVFDPNKIDRWEATYDVLAPGQPGCAGAKLLRTFPAKYEQAGCEFLVDWVVIFAQVKMSLLLYMTRSNLHSSSGSVETRIYPTVQVAVYAETALRPRGAGNCYLDAPWLQPGPIQVLHQPCVRIPRAGTNVENERIIVYVNGKDVELPRFVRWKGERGPETTPPWKNIYAGAGGVQGGGGVNDSWTCCMAKAIKDYKIPGKGQRTAGNQLAQLNGYNPTGVEHWQGYATIDPNANGNVDNWCYSTNPTQNYLGTCTEPEDP